MRAGGTKTLLASRDFKRSGDRRREKREIEKRIILSNPQQYNRRNVFDIDGHQESDWTCLEKKTKLKLHFTRYLTLNTVVIICIEFYYLSTRTVLNGHVYPTQKSRPFCGCTGAKTKGYEDSSTAVSSRVMAQESWKTLLLFICKARDYDNDYTHLCV